MLKSKYTQKLSKTPEIIEQNKNTNHTIGRKLDKPTPIDVMPRGDFRR